LPATKTPDLRHKADTAPAVKESPVTEQIEKAVKVVTASTTKAKATPKEEVKAEPKEEPATAPPPSKITIEEIRAVQSEKSTSGKRDGVKALLAEFGVAKLTDMDEAQYPAYLPKLLAL